MTNRFANSLFAIALLGASACSDGNVASGPIVPPTQALGVIRGTVSGRVMTAEYEPMGGSAALANGMSPQIYGGPATVKVSGTVDNLIDVPGVSRTWIIRVHMQNLLSYPIGSNQGGAAPTDIMGVFLAFTSTPVVTQPTACLGVCTVSISNNSGTGNFGSPGQPYFYYHDRPTAVQGSPSTDTTSDDVWKFTTTFFSGADTTHAFTFSLIVSAAWPPGQGQVSWINNYDWTQDSLPDTQASPPWVKWHATNTGDTLGTETFTSGVQLQLNNTNNRHSIYFSRNDSIGTGSFHIDATLKLANAQNNTVQAVIGWAEQTVTGRQLFLGVASNRVCFVSYNQGSGQWANFNPANQNCYTAGGTFNGTLKHSYRIRKLGTTDAHMCVDGVDTGLSKTYNNWNLRRADFNGRSTAWGSDGAALVGGVVTNWTALTYEIGNDGGSC